VSSEPAIRSTALRQLRIQSHGSDRLLLTGRSYRIGRNPDADIVVDDPRVSWYHASVELRDAGWLLRDAGPTNGMFVNGQRVAQVFISEECTVRLGHPEQGPWLVCSLPGLHSYHPDKQVDRRAWQLAVTDRLVGPPAAARRSLPPAATRVMDRPLQPWLNSDRSPDATVRLPGQPLPSQPLRIGRASDNDVVVPDLSVSRYHAELRRGGDGGFEIVDLDSYNGTFVDGQRISSAPVTHAHLIGIGPATLCLVGDQLQEFIDTGDMTLRARDLTVRLPNGKVLLDQISFPLGERCLLGVIGPSGAGKSTLLGAMTGIRPATSGSMLYDGRNLYKHYAELRHRIGLVPQENVLHAQLSARRALGYAAELRFPRDTSRGERSRRIDEVLAELSLTAHADTRTAALSGGEQKRVNVALELLTKPSLLFLDEPTSGLDPGLDKSVMEMMADLAHDGRTVIVVTHSAANLHLCDRLLVLVPGGKMAFFGTPADGLRHFGKPGWAEVFQSFDAEPGRDWAGEFRSSPYYRRYISAELNDSATATCPPDLVRAKPVARNRLGQLGTLCRRYAAVIASDRIFLAVLAAMPLLVGLLIRAVPAARGLASDNDDGAESLLLVLVIGGCFTGSANAIRELVKERAIYARERAAGLSSGAYLLSKLIVLGAISGLQAVILVAIGLAGRQLPAHGAVLADQPLAELLLAVVALSIASMTLGLLISVLVNTSDKTMPMLVVAVMFQVILSGAIFPLHGKTGIEQLAWFSPSRWSYAATASTTNLNKLIVPTVSGLTAAHSASATDPLWNHAARTWLTDMLTVVPLALAFMSLTWWRLVSMGPARRRRLRRRLEPAPRAEPPGVHRAPAKYDDHWLGLLVQATAERPPSGPRRERARR
jgi:ABC-type multidrug transport system ATPase subunit/pSer/pThr/pTyr-binding forkhead associated (FHA) protein